MRWFMEVIYDFFTSFAGVCVIVAAGYLVGRVRVRGISLGLAGVLICAVFFGAAFSACGFDVSSVPMFGVLIAFKDFTLTDGFIGSEWVGLKYFKHIVLGADENVFLVFRNTIYIALIRVATNFPAILIFALMIN